MNVNLGNEGVLCPNCGMTNKQGYRFCVKCGTNLATSQKPVEEPAVTPSFSTFEQPKPVEEPTVMPSFSAFKQPDVPEKPSKENPLKNIQPMESGFARYDFSGTTTSTASVGTFATTFNAVKEEKMDVGDAQKILSLLDEKEKSALAEGLPEWDIVPPQVVVRRKHRV